MAKITTLIPAYKKEYLGEMFLGLRRQTFRDFRVILSDDSPGDTITEMIRSGHFGDLLAGLDLQVVRGPKNARLNHEALIDLWNGSTPFVHLQLDDDVIYPDFYRSHLEAHATGRFSASVSRRWITNVDTRPVIGIELPRFVADSPLRVVPVDTQALFSSMVPTCNNWLGEFTNMLLSAEGAARWPRPPALEMNYYGWPDVGFVLEQQLPIAYIRDHLSVFRQHPEQTTHNIHAHGGIVSAMAWATCALQAWREQRITYEQAVNSITYTVMQCLKKFGDQSPVINEFLGIVQHQGTSLDRLYAAYKPFWLRTLASNPATAPAGTPRLLHPSSAPAHTGLAVA